MIITKQAAKELNKDKLAGMATQYANELAENLGSNAKVEILPQEVIYDSLEAKEFFTKSKSIGILNLIEEVCPFVEEGVAYIPLSDLSQENERMISKVIPDNAKTSQLKNMCMSLEGFGAEIAHLVGHKLYGPKTISGLGEALDIVSHQIYEDLIDMKIISELADEKKNLSELEKEVISTKIDLIRKEISVYEELLFKGEDSAKRIVKKVRPKLDDYIIKILIEDYKRYYISTAHFDGYKVFLEIYNKENGNIKNVCKTLGRLLADPEVNLVEDALKKLGYSNTDLEKYSGTFSTKPSLRAKRLSRHAKVYCKPIIVFTP